MKKIMVIAGEASGDMHGANLVKAMKSINSDLYFCGVGDEALRQAGVEIIVESREISVVGLIEVVFHLRDIRRAFKLIVNRLQKDQPALLILIDFPDFNLMLAKQAKKIGIPVFYYISPQVWAWRSGRVNKIARLVDKLAVILPFEKDFYTQRGVEIVEFVGHPLVDCVTVSEESETFRPMHSIPATATVVGMLPGSRIRELRSILPEFIEAAHKLKQQKKELCFLMPLAPTLEESDLEISDEIKTLLNLKIVRGQRYDLMANCDLVMVASGTVTLELALLNVPMVVVYRISPLTYFLGRRLIKVKFASLVNLIAGKEVVKELLQNDFTADALVAALLDIWPGTDKHKQLKTQLEYIRGLVGPAGASKRVAKLALQIMN
nr:lipid-A-disaccharide synthase [Desulfobulbaceae bacterium]